MKKGVIILIAILVIAVIGVVGYVFVLPNIAGNTNDTSFVYVEKVSDILTGFVFTSNRYNAIVETQETVAIEAEMDKKIKTTFVSAGDVVKKGDKLFEYDVDEMKITLDQYKLDIEQYASEIKSYNEQIDSLEKERKNATANQQLNLTNQIESLKLDIKKAEYAQQTTQRNIEKMERSIKNSVITSTTDGSVLSVNDPNAKGYVMITSSGDYRVKAIVNEVNISSIEDGANVIIRSRVSEDITWRGTISKIDTAHPITNASNSTMGGMGGTGASEETSTTKYPVYIDLVSSDGLMVGQHVTVEIDNGLGDEEKKEGMWLYDYYICDVDSSPYVWAESSNGTLEKRSVVLGEYDENSFKYEIKSGLTEDDSIAFPESTFTEGMIATHNIEDVPVKAEEGEEIVAEDGIENGVDVADEQISSEGE